MKTVEDIFNEVLDKEFNLENQFRVLVRQEMTHAINELCEHNGGEINVSLSEPLPLVVPSTGFTHFVDKILSEADGKFSVRFVLQDGKYIPSDDLDDDSIVRVFHYCAQYKV